MVIYFYTKKCGKIYFFLFCYHPFTATHISFSSYTNVHIIIVSHCVLSNGFFTASWWNEILSRKGTLLISQIAFTTEIYEEYLLCIFHSWLWNLIVWWWYTENHTNHHPPSSSIFKRLASVIRTNIHYYHFLDFLSLVFIFLTYCMHNNHLTDSLLNIFVIFSLYLCCLLEWLRVTIMLWSAIKYNNVVAIKFVSYFSYIYNTYVQQPML